MSGEIETVIKIFLTKTTTTKAWSQMYNAEIKQNFKEELMIILIKVFHNIETKEIFPNSFYKAIVSHMPKLHKNSTNKQDYILPQ